MSTWLHTSPAILLAAHAKRAVENDNLLTNGYRKNVVSFPLPDGKRMLVTKGDLERDVSDPDDKTVRERAEYVAWWSEHLARRGTRMIVLLVPEKIAVYGPALGVKLPQDHYLTRFERELAARGIRVVNGLPLLRATAESDLASGQLAYLREDMHWTALGVQRLARATAAAVRTDYGSVLSAASGPE
jgi:hypothetical protein